MSREFKERQAVRINGFLALLGQLALGGGIAGLIWRMAERQEGTPLEVVALILLVLTSFIVLGGYYVVQPNETKVLLFFGKYIGNVRANGFWWYPLANKVRVSSAQGPLKGCVRFAWKMSPARM